MATSTITQLKFKTRAMIRLRALAILCILAFQAMAQDKDYARFLIDTLSSPAFDGRGYVNEGDRKAANFLAKEFQKLSLEPFGNEYLQYYQFSMNTLPGKLSVSIDEKQLAPGKEFQVWAASPGISGDFKIRTLCRKILENPRKFNRFLSRDYSGEFILVDRRGIKDKKILSKLDSLKFTNIGNSAGLIYTSDNKLTWSVMIGMFPRKYPVIDIRSENLPENARKISIEVESRYIKNHRTQNVAGFIQGAGEPDTFLVFTAHYDHLGRMGQDVYYPGANDNASGVAMVTDLARHYSASGNRPWYSMAFILLSGEEAGLHGAEYFASNPLFDLNKVKFLINLDMVGTGSEGITMVNATQFKQAFKRMVSINASQEYILTVKERGESCNSDHCPFYKKGVPAVFIYSMGKEFGEYHNPDDRSYKLPLSEYSDIFRLMRDFMDSARNW